MAGSPRTAVVALSAKCDGDAGHVALYTKMGCTLIQYFFILDVFKSGGVLLVHFYCCVADAEDLMPFVWLDMRMFVCVKVCRFKCL